MAHAVFAVYASQGTHAEFAERIGAMEFELEGPLRKGKVRPVLSEWKLYDVRLPKPCMQDFVNRAGIAPLYHKNKSTQMDNQGLWVLRWIFWLIQRFTPLKRLPIDWSVKPDFLSNSWEYKFQVGIIDDPQMKIYTKSDKTREVL